VTGTEKGYCETRKARDDTYSHMAQKKKPATGWGTVKWRKKRQYLEKKTGAKHFEKTD